MRNPNKMKVDKELAGRWSRPGGTWTHILLAIVGIVAFAVFLVFRMSAKSTSKAHVSEAMSNARQISLALSVFRQAYQSCPDEITAKKVRTATGKSWGFGTGSSNAYFRQLLAAGAAESEVMFFARIPGVLPKNDNVYHTDASALEKGECGFSYLAGAKPKSNPARPIVVTPLLPGRRVFDREALDGNAIIVRLDGSVIRLSIDRQGRVLQDGKDLMDPSHPIWEGRPPEIAWPDL